MSSTPIAVLSLRVLSLSNRSLIINKAEKELTQARIRSINNILTSVSTQLQQCRSQLAAIISTETLRECQDFVDKVGEIRFIKVKDRQIKKFQNLVNKKQGNITWSSNNNNNSNPFPTASNANRQAGAPPLPSREGSNTPPVRPLPPSQEGESLNRPTTLTNPPSQAQLPSQEVNHNQAVANLLPQEGSNLPVASSPPPAARPWEGSQPPTALPPARDGGSPPPNRAI